MSHEKSESMNRLQAQINGMEKILSMNSDGIIDDDTKKKIIELKEKAEFLKSKLEKNEFEIAIVGLEKSGKSTFANAMMGIDILPSRDARCTYTSTSIRYGDTNYAEVEFFSYDEFKNNFSDRLKMMGIENAENLSFRTLTLEEYKDIFKNLSDNIRSLYSGTVNKDVENIIKYKDTINTLLGKPKKIFSGDSELKNNNFKKFIENPEYAIAVKTVTIKSNKLKKENEVFYDVPGFDSPTQMHKDQTIEKMRKSDVIILIENASKPSLTGPLIDIFRNESDDDNIKFGDKMFVFANMADRATSLNENIKILKNDLKDYSIMNEFLIDKRVIAGSARAKLEEEDSTLDQTVSNSLKNKGISNGIDDIRSRLKTYNDNERLTILDKRVLNYQNQINNLFSEIFEKENVFSYNSPSLQAKLSDIEHSKYIARNKIKKEIESYKNQLANEYAKPKPITQRLKSEIIDEFTSSSYTISNEDLEAAKNEAGDTIGGTNVTDVDRNLRKKIFRELYKKYTDRVVELSINEHKNCDIKIKSIFMNCLESRNIDNELDQYIQNVKGANTDKGYYRSLVERFSSDLFELLIKNSFGSMERWNRFEGDRQNFNSLAVYNLDDNSDLNDAQSLFYLMLLHDKKCINVKKYFDTACKIVSEVLGNNLLPNDKMSRLIRNIAGISLEKTVDIINEKCQNLPDDKYSTLLNRLEDILGDHDGEANISKELTMETYIEYFKDKNNKTPDTVREEIHEDIDILHDVLKTVAVNAMNIDKSFIAYETQILDDIIKSLEDEDGRFWNFIQYNINIIASEEINNLNDAEQKNQLHKNICTQIKDILDSMKNINIVKSDENEKEPVMV